ncbi:YfhO family protein [Candidatus Woesebacteria bacterium]|nr:YfhO family protein [Candidatus Woesebacteria bacterium]
MKKIITSPVFWFLIVIGFLFKDFIFFGKVPIPIDILIGAYFPWLDYKWGYAVGVPVKNPIAADAFATFFVWKKLMAELFRDGVLPLWNRYSFSGTPLLATFHSAVLFPANVLFALPFNLGWSLNILLACIAAASSMYLFLKEKVSSKAAQLAGSLIYALAGLMTTWAQYGTGIWAASLLPLILLCLDAVISAKGKIYFFLLSVLFAILAFAGHVQLLTYAMVISPIYFFHSLKKIRGKINLALTFNVALAILLGLGIGAIQILPSLEFSGRSIRAEENYASSFNYGLSHWTEMIRLWAADFFGNPATGNFFGKIDYNEYTGYLGVLSLPLILGYLFSKGFKKKKPIFFVCIFFISLFLVYDNPVSKFIFSLPVPLLTYSSASRLFFLTNLAAAVLVSHSLNNLISDRTALPPIRMVSIVLILITLIGLLFVPQQFQPVSLRNSIPYISALLLFFIASILLHKKPKLLILLIVVIFGLDLGRYYNKYNTFVPAHLIFPSTPVIDFLKKQPGIFRISKENTNLLPANSWIAYKLESPEGYDPLYGIDYAHFFHKLNGGLYTDTIGRIATLDRFNPKYMDAINVKYILTKSESMAQQLIKDGFEPVFADKSVTIYQNPHVLERAYFIDKIRFAKNKKEVGEILDDPQFDPTKEAIVLGKAFDIVSGGKTVTSINHEDNKVEIKTKNEKEGFLVLADSYDPGWISFINGNRSTIYLVDGALRGVRVPSGENLVSFRYEPVSFKYGLLISLLSAIFVLVHQLGLHLLKRNA